MKINMCNECIPCILVEDDKELDVLSTELEISEALDSFISEPIRQYNYKAFSLENKYVHNKTENIYCVLDLNVIDCTNSSKDRSTVLYTDSSGKIYVREKEEFFSKFTKM